jgi:hypothetical protein
MSVDYLDCDNPQCVENFPDDGEFGWCAGDCQSVFCEGCMDTVERVFEDGRCDCGDPPDAHIDRDGPCEACDECEGYEEDESTTCMLCRGEEVLDSDLLKFAAERLHLKDRAGLVKLFRRYHPVE